MSIPHSRTDNIVLLVAFSICDYLKCAPRVSNWRADFLGICRLQSRQMSIEKRHKGIALLSKNEKLQNKLYKSLVSQTAMAESHLGMAHRASKACPYARRP